MDDTASTTPAKSLEERMIIATERQKMASKTLELTRTNLGADLMGIVARQRVMKHLLIQAGLVRDVDGMRPNDDELEILWIVLEAEAKAEVYEDLLKVARGEETPHATMRRVIPAS